MRRKYMKVEELTEVESAEDCSGIPSASEATQLI